VSAIHKH